MNKILLFAISLLLHTTVYGQNIKLVKDIRPGSLGSDPRILASLSDGDILFMAYDTTNGYALRRSDGTDTGTTVVYGIQTTGNHFTMYYYSSIYVNGKLFFIAADGTHGHELWISDGTTAGTHMVKDIYTGATDGVHIHSHMTYYNGRVYFMGIDAAHGKELWSSDGTASGTKLVKDINYGTKPSSPKRFYPALGKLFFYAKTETDGVELWSTDGTDTGTSMVIDLYSGSTRGIPDESNNMIVYQGKLYFLGNDGSGFDLYYTDGTASGTKKAYLTYGGDKCELQRMFEVINGKLFYRGYTNKYGSEVYVTDSTGSSMIKDIRVGSGDANPFLLGQLNDKLLFRANDTANGEELWVTDGTANGTQIIKDVNTGNYPGHHITVSEEDKRYGFVNVSGMHNGIYYFAGDDGQNSIELWRTDGTDTGTYMIEDVGNIPDSSVSSELDFIFVDSNHVWLSMTDGVTGKELYIYKHNTGSTIFVENVQKTVVLSSIYPNPSNGNFTLELKKNDFVNGYLKVTDILGHTIYDQSITKSEQKVLINLSHLPKGIYHVTVQLDNRINTHAVSLE